MYGTYHRHHSYIKQTKKPTRIKFINTDNGRSLSFTILIFSKFATMNRHCIYNGTDKLLCD